MATIADDGRQVMAIAHTGELKINNYLSLQTIEHKKRP
jgi:hypothetical protein